MTTKNSQENYGKKRWEEQFSEGSPPPETVGDREVQTRGVTERGADQRGDRERGRPEGGPREGQTIEGR